MVHQKFQFRFYGLALVNRLPVWLPAWLAATSFNGASRLLLKYALGFSKVLAASLCLVSSNVLFAAETQSENFDTRNAVVGFWASESSIFEIRIKNDTLTGEVRALLNPTYLSQENNSRQGQVRTDDNNPEESQRTKPLIGLSMFSEYEFKEDQWQGKIYDPESGNTYQSRMKLNKNDDLEIRGYIGMPMFGRTAVFVAASTCSDSVVEMLPQMTNKNAVQCSKSAD